MSGKRIPVTDAQIYAIQLQARYLLTSETREEFFKRWADFSLSLSHVCNDLLVAINLEEDNGKTVR